MKALFVPARAAAQVWFALMCSCAAAAAAAGGLPADPGAKGGQDAVTYQINTAHSGSITLSGGFNPPLTEAWTVNLGAYVSYPLIAKGMVFVTLGGSNAPTMLTALSLSSGTVAWQKLLPGTGWADAAYDRDAVFVVNSLGQLAAYRASGGSHLWTTQLPGNNAQAVGAPTASGGTIYVQTEATGKTNGIVSAIDETNGSAKWSAVLASVTGGTGGSVTLGDQGIFVGNSDIYKLNPGNGTEKWIATLGCAPADAPVYYNKTIYVPGQGSCDSTMFNSTTGTLTGYFAGTGSPVLFSKKGALITEDSKLYDYSPSNGQIYWSFGDGGTLSKPVAVNGEIAVISTSGTLYLLDGSTGRQLWTTTLSYSTNPSGGPDTGLGAGDGALVVPSGQTLTAFTPG